MEDAACKNSAPRKRGDDDIFFPEKGQTGLVRDAQMLCMQCPVLRACAEYRKQTNSGYGVWAAQLASR